MKIRGLRQPIPKHIYRHAEAADLGRPDFYVGPTETKRARRNDSLESIDEDRDLETQMRELKEEAQGKKEP